jgi:hypothetical protein
VTLLDAALDLHKHGCSVVPAATDGTKRPAIAWKNGQARRAEASQLDDWFGNRIHRVTPLYDGLGVITGAISGNLEMLEVEGRASHLVSELAKLMADNGFADLWTRLCSGYLEQSPSGGLHWLYRVDGPARPNTKLARRPHPDNPALVDVLIETRGEGGFTVTAPSAGRTHPTGLPWRLLAGTPATIPTLTIDERDAVHAIANMLDEMPAIDEPTRPLSTVGSSGGKRPGDDYNARADWADIIGAHGWTRTKHFGGTCYGWTRPGKNPRDGISATTGRNDADNLYVFTSSTEFDTEKAYSKFAAYTLLEHNGDYAVAAGQLRKDGYGESKPALSLVPSPSGPPTEPPAPTATDEGTPERPSLNVGNAADMAQWLRTNVGTGPLAGMFIRGHDIVHTPQEGEDGYVPLSESGGDDDGPAQVRVIRKSTLASRVQYGYDCHKFVKRDKEWVATPAMFPVDAARVATDVPEELVNLRRLRGVVHSPVLRADGSILFAPGYDETTGLLHLPEQGLVVPDVSDQPTRAQVHAAVALLDEMTAGFSFVTPNDRANYYGMLLTPLLRTMTPPPYKLAAISSPQPGSGKTLLATIARLIHGGVFRAEMPEDDAELRKQVTAMLTVTTGPIIHFDNVSGVMRSSTLAGLLTSATWGDRPLGVTEWVGTPNDRLWMITGNNLLLGGDLVRRTLWVAIDPHVPHPERRTGFAIADLEQWVTERRGEILHALLTMVRSWVAAGSPMGASRSSDGYSRWSNTVTAILEHAGIPGVFADTGSAPQELGDDDDDWVEFLQAVHDTFGGDPWTVKDLLTKVDATTKYDLWAERADLPIKMSSLPADLQDKAARPSGLQGIGRSLGKWLRNRDGRWAGDYCVRFVREGHARERFWRVECAPEVLGDSGDSRSEADETQIGDRGDSGDSSYGPNAGSEKDLFIRVAAESLSPKSPLSPASDDPLCTGCGRGHGNPNSMLCDECMDRARRDAKS